MFGARHVASSGGAGSWPILAGSAVTNSTQGSTTTHTFSLPSGISGGDLLVALVCEGGGLYTPTISGWSFVRTQYNSYYGFTAFSKIASGSEGASISCVFNDAVSKPGCIVLRFTGANTINGTVGLSYNPNPNMVSHTPVHSGKKYFYLCVHTEAGNQNTVGTPPTNYTAGEVSCPNPVDGGRASVRYCYRSFLETAEDPGVWLIGGSYPSYGTFAIYAV